MRNDIFKAKELIGLISTLPLFSAKDIFPIVKNKSYAKIILSRYGKKGEIIRLKKGLYVSGKYLDFTEKNNFFSEYLEFVANAIYESSYLSLDWVLSEKNILTEAPKNFTSVSLAKTAVFSNKLGNFFYHKIKKELFIGYEILKIGDFTVRKATTAKALFDFLYFRKNSLNDNQAIKELRLNLENFKAKDWQELKKYTALEGSKKMKEIMANLKK